MSYDMSYDNVCESDSWVLLLHISPQRGPSVVWQIRAHR